MSGLRERAMRQKIWNNCKEENWKGCCSGHWSGSLLESVFWIDLKVPRGQNVDCLFFLPQLLPQRCTWLYVMNNVLMSVSGNKSLQMSANTECCMFFPTALTKCPSRREVVPALLPQSDGPVWAERTSAEETQQSVTQHQPLHWEDQPQVGQDTR